MFFWIDNGIQSSYTPPHIRPDRVHKMHSSRDMSKKSDEDSGSGVAYFGPAQKEDYYESKAKAAYEETKKNLDKDSIKSPAIQASQIMSKPVVTLDKLTPIEDALMLFKEKRFRHVPIVDEEKKLCGILSDRSLLSFSPSEKKIDFLFGKNVQDFMIFKVLLSKPEAKIRDIAKTLLEARIGAMPIVDNLLVPIGIITRSDILRTIVSHEELELWI